MSFFKYPRNKLLSMKEERVLNLLYKEFIKRSKFNEKEIIFLMEFFKQKQIEEISEIFIKEDVFNNVYIFEKLLLKIEEKLKITPKRETIDIERDNPSNTQKYPNKVILWNLRSVFNVGSIIRSCDCLGIEEVFLCGYTPYSDDIKSLMKSQKYMKITREENILDIIKKYKKTHSIIAIEHCEGSVNIEQSKIEFPIISLFGNEKYGLSKEILNNSDIIYEIPMWGYKYSMNVANAFSIATYEFRRQYNLL